MFCPKCSEAQVSADVRFCKRCGFHLAAVQDLIAHEAKSKSRADGLLPKQKDISLGAGLMFVGSVVAMVWARAHRGADGDVLPQVFLILGFTLGFILLLFPTVLSELKRLFSGSTDSSGKRGNAGQTRKQRDGINLGAVLMFLGTVKALILSTFITDPGQRPALTVAIAAGMFLLLLVIRWIVETVYRALINSDEQSETERVTGALASTFEERELQPALAPAGQNNGVPVEVFRPARPEMAHPGCVTENTTDLLRKL